MKKLVRTVVLAGALAASGIGLAAGPASAETIRQEGCVEWNSTQGCVVKQSCSLDTVSRTYSCLTWDTRTKMLVGQTGAY